jgi:uncharacterized SAM-binding protein YcdF (DUF218 family)
MTRSLAGASVRLLLVVLAVCLPLAIGFVHFADNLPEPTAAPGATDAIVVLTGGSERVAAGLTLLEAGKAKRLFISGVHPGVELDDLLKIDREGSGGAPLSASLAARVELGHEAGDTFGNAVESAEWMRANRFRSLRLVTADYHMRRALIEFRMADPDLEIVPNPVRPTGRATEHWWRNRSTLNLLMAEYGKYLIAKWRYIVNRATTK